MLRKYKQSTFYILILLIFYPIIFEFFGKNIQDGYKIAVLLFTLWVCNKKNVFAKLRNSDNIIILTFIAFCLSFFYSAINNGDGWTIILSQFSRYIIAFCLWFLVRYELSKKNADNELFLTFTYQLILMQIIISIGKLIIFQGTQIEGLVGSIAFGGGAAGTTIPILGFITLWFYKKGKLEKLDWLFVIGLMMIGFLAGKRAVWFITPLVIASFMIYVPKLKLNKTLLATVMMAPLAFYFGVRLTPNMNPENKVWGSFDYEHVFDFAEKYQFGDKTKVTSEKLAQGRGGASIMLWDKWFSDETLTQTDWYGTGLRNVHATTYEDFMKLNTGISSKANNTGVVVSFLTNGYMGVFTTVLLFYSMLWQIKMKRIRWVLMAIVAWEYFMYTGTIFRTPAFMFLLIYFIHYSNILSQKRPKKVQIPNFPIIKNDKSDIGN